MLQQKRIDEHNYTLGMYIERATLVSVSTCLNGKSDIKYFDEPLMADFYRNRNLSQEEIDNRELEKLLFREKMWIESQKQSGLPINNRIKE